MKLFFIKAPNVLFIILFRSNLVTEVSFKHKVDCEDVNRLKSLALLEILTPNPLLVIIFWLSKKTVY